MNKKSKYILILLAVVVLAGAAAYATLLSRNMKKESVTTMRNGLETIK